mmetsp:Transcript_21842/g.50970  ORF Transcript_21842/g.50970 Transcript_21842/m.50970 type:complete len:108 (+) Transcript_21842:219-542(+)
MEELALAVAKEREPDAASAERTNQIAEEIRSTAGEHALADAAGIVALFAAITIVVDIQGHSSPELEKLAPVMNWVARTKKRAEGWIMPAFGVVGIAAVAATAVRLAS